jgi:hypothetical protein
MEKFTLAPKNVGMNNGNYARKFIIDGNKSSSWFDQDVSEEKIGLVEGSENEMLKLAESLIDDGWDGGVSELNPDGKDTIYSVGGLCWAK